MFHTVNLVVDLDFEEIAYIQLEAMQVPAEPLEILSDTILAPKLAIYQLAVSIGLGILIC